MNRRELIKGVCGLIGISILPAATYSTCAVCGARTPRVPDGYLAFCEPCGYMIGDAVDGGLGKRWKENGWGPFYVRFGDMPVHGAVRVA